VALHILTKLQHYPSDSWNDVGTNLYGCFKQLNLLKRKNRNLKVLLSIGGWTYSSNFASPASNSSGRSTFAQSALSLVKNLGLDGIDIDWEYPKDSSQAHNLVLLLKECREALDAYGNSLTQPHHFELTIACPAGPQNYQKMDLRGMDQYLDFFNLMAYDFAGSWDTRAGHQANLFPSKNNPDSTPFSADTAVKYYISQGVPASKIVLGMPIYGRAFENTDGLGKPFSGTGQGTWENGVHDFKKLPLDEAREDCDEEAGATYSYDPVKRVLVTYDTVEMARKKAGWIRQEGLGGAMWWESSADDVEESSLINSVVDVLGGSGGMGMEAKENCLGYPESKYENLKKGFAGEC
jgi:chitinase